MRFTIYESRLEKLASENRLRTIPPSPCGESRGEACRILVDLSSNDYMGLAEDSDSLPLCFDGLPDSLLAEYDSLRKLLSLDNPGMWSASASRLLMSRQSVPALLEKFLEADYGRPALLFNSGYHANVGAIGALNDSGVMFLVDKLMHASAYDGLRACGANFDRFRHNDVGHLERLVNKYLSMPTPPSVIVVVTEALFSMDGDRAPLHQLVALRDRYANMLLYVDEAHSYGCFGPRGLGLSAECGVLADVDVLVGTFGKAAASAGAFVVAPRILHDSFVNTARSFIFSTALPPAVYLKSLENHLRLRGADFRRKALAEVSLRVRNFVEHKFGPTPSSSHIIPIVVGDAARAVSLAASLREKGFVALPIRRPTVPPGGERVRISLSALHNSAAWSNFEV